MDKKLGKERKTEPLVRHISYMAHKHAYALSLIREEGSFRMHNSKLVMRVYG
jgi:hypothetical protein